MQYLHVTQDVRAALKDQRLEQLEHHHYELMLNLIELSSDEAFVDREIVTDHMTGEVRSQYIEWEKSIATLRTQADQVEGRIRALRDFDVVVVEGVKDGEEDIEQTGTIEDLPVVVNPNE